MNFYKHHIGDYAQATAHLSFVEDAAYSRVLRKYYADERPMPADVKAVQRLVGARTREEKEAVQSVLSEFFELRGDGWHNKRCDAELTKASAQADTNRRIAEEREARRRERSQHESLNDSSTKPLHDSFKPGEHDSLPTREPSQTPDSKTPDSRLQTPDLEEGGCSSPVDSADTSPRPSMAAAVCLALKAEGVGSVSPGHPRLLALIDSGAEVQNFVSAARAAISKGKGFAYILGMVEGQLADARQLAAAGRAAPAAPTRANKAAAQAATLGALSGRTNPERNHDADRSERPIDVDARVVDRD